MVFYSWWLSQKQYTSMLKILYKIRPKKRSKLKEEKGNIIQQRTFDET